VAVPTLAAEPPRQPLATPVFDSAVLRFEPRVEAAGWVLTVAGPEGFYVRHSSQGSTPELALAGPNAEPLPSGHYTWELRAAAQVLPTSSVDAAAAVATDLERDVQWGHFRVQAGQVLAPDPEANERAGTPLPAETVVTESLEGGPTHGTDVDVYIDGHLCVGGGPLDSHCTGVESLALRTILVKEDNNRIHFEDTSTLAGFATTDWRITINSSTNDDAAFFAIEDLDEATVPFTIEGGADDNALWVDENGRVGVGTSTPNFQLHVNGDAFVSGDFSAASSRELKHSFVEVEPADVLDRLAQLTVAEWSYRADSSGARHLGPVAEDFHRLFSLGRDEHRLSPLDLSGVAFAAIQGLNARVAEREADTRARLDEKDAEIAELRRSRDELVERLAVLEELVRTGAAR
jgi:hypothetical protein